MKLIVGLGNPGEEHKQHRHNIGFMVVEKVAELLDQNGEGKWQEESKFKANVLRQGELLLIKPLTFMNNSGVAVRLVKDFYKIEIDRILLVHDDLDLRLGETKLNFAKGPKVHNGVDSVEQALKNKDFWRLRLGVDNRGEDRVAGDVYVLTDFAKEERVIVSSMVEKGAKEALSWALG